MKHYALVLLSLLLSLAAVSPAQTAVPNKVGVIQIQAAMVSTKDGQAAAADLENRMAPKRKELEKLQGDIKDLQEKLQRGGNTMSQSAKDDLARQIDQKTKNLNRDMEDAQAELDQEQRKVVDNLSSKLMPVIDKYAQENGYSVILDVSNPNTPVIYASNAVDITKDIIELYDKTAPATPPAKSGAAKPAPAKPPAAAQPKPSATPLAPPPAAPAKKQP